VYSPELPLETGDFMLHLPFISINDLFSAFKILPKRNKIEISVYIIKHEFQDLRVFFKILNKLK
jgi:hypothetical protein